MTLDVAPGLYRDNAGRVVLVQRSTRGHWYAHALRSRADGTIAREYLGHRVRNLQAITLDQATEILAP